MFWKGWPPMTTETASSLMNLRSRHSTRVLLLRRMAPLGSSSIHMAYLISCSGRTSHTLSDFLVKAPTHMAFTARIGLKPNETRPLMTEKKSWLGVFICIVLFFGWMVCSTAFFYTTFYTAGRDLVHKMFSLQ